MPLSLSRRAFAFGLPTAGFTAGAQTLPVRAASTQPASAVMPLAQIKVGRFTVTALTDGYADMPYGYRGNSVIKHASYVPVDLTLRKYVRKPRGSKPGAALYTHERTLYVD